MIKAEGIDTVTDETFDDVVMRPGLPVLVEFTAGWRPPCRQLGPVLSAIAVEEAERLRIVQIDADTNPEMMTRYGVLSMPTMLVFSEGRPVKSLVGARPKRRLLEDLADVL